MKQHEHGMLPSPGTNQQSQNLQYQALASYFSPDLKGLLKTLHITAIVASAAACPVAASKAWEGPAVALP